MKVRVNLATKPLETHRRFFLGAWIVGLLAGLLFLALGAHVFQVLKANREYRIEAAQVERKMADLQRERKELEQFFNRPENAKLHDRAVYVNGLIDARSFNWTQMFMEMEKLLPGGVHLISVDPKLTGGRVELKMVVGATNEEAKLKFLHALETSKELTHVELLSERAPAANESGDISVMELTAWYSRA